MQLVQRQHSSSILAIVIMHCTLAADKNGTRQSTRKLCARETEHVLARTVKIDQAQISAQTCCTYHLRVIWYDASATVLIPAEFEKWGQTPGNGRQPWQNDCANSVCSDRDVVNRCQRCDEHCLIDLLSMHDLSSLPCCQTLPLAHEQCYNPTRLRNLRSTKTLRRSDTSINSGTLDVSTASDQHVWNVF